MSSERQDRLIADISGRLRNVCMHLSDDEFAAFVRDIANVTMKYEGRPTAVARERTSSHDRAADAG